MTPLDMATAERSELAQLLATLTPDQWNHASLCPGWRVRDVVAHMISYDDQKPTAVMGWFLRGRFNIARVNAIGVTAAEQLTPDQLLGRLRSHLTPAGLTAGFRGAIGLVDGMIHQQDIRRALDRPRSIPQERIVFALNFALRAPTIPARKLTRQLRLVATDMDWASGTGREVQGKAEALLMAAAGRRGVVEELAGPGQSLLAQRIEQLA